MALSVLQDPQVLTVLQDQPALTVQRDQQDRLDQQALMALTVRQDR